MDGVRKAAPFGVHGLHRRTGAPMALREPVRGMAREYAAGNSLGPGWHESAGIFGCPVGGSVADGAVSGMAAAGPRQPAIRKMQGQPRRAGEPSGQGEEPPPEGLGGGYPLSQTDPRRPDATIVWTRRRSGPRGDHAVLEVARGQPPVRATPAPGCIAYLAEGESEASASLSRTSAASASAWKGVQVVRGRTVHPVRNRRPGIFGYRLDEIVQAADGYHAMSVEPAVGP